MHIDISVEELTRGLYRAQGIVDRKATMPILANVLIEATGDRVLLTATDLELGLNSEHPADVKTEGKVTVPAKALLDIVRSLPAATVTLSRESNNWVEITSGQARFRLVGQDPADFPAGPQTDDISFVDVPAALLQEMLDKSSYAVSTDETRYSLNGVYLEQVDGVTRMVATDGHRLALVERPLEGDLGLDKGIIVPRKGLAEMKRLLGEKHETVSLGFSGTNAVFKTEGLVLVMRLVDGTFPDYQQVIPASSPSPVVVGREQLLGTLKRVSLVSPDRAPAVKIVLAPSTLTVISENPDLGEAKESLEVKYDGGELSVGFNAKYLIEVLSVVDDEQVRVEVTDELSPAVVRPAEGEGYTAVVMPMRI